MYFRNTKWLSSGINSKFEGGNYLVTLIKFWKNHFCPLVVEEIPVTISALKMPIGAKNPN
jgi:hypothetical protein